MKREHTPTPWETEALKRYPVCEGRGLELSAQSERAAFTAGAQFGLVWGLTQLDASRTQEIIRLRQLITDLGSNPDF